MKDFEKQMRELEQQMTEMGERLNKLYSEKYAKKFEDLGRKISEKFQVDADLHTNDDAEENGGGESNIEKILPYLDEDSLHELVVSFINGESDVDMKKVLVYLEEEDISLLIKKLAECDGQEFNGLTVNDLLPYAEEEAVDVLFMKGVRAGVIDKQLMSYVSDDCWHELVKEYCKDENSTLNIDEVFPFLDEDDIRLIFKTYLKRQKKSV